MSTALGVLLIGLFGRTFVGIVPGIERPEVKIEDHGGRVIYLFVNQSDDVFTFESVDGVFPNYRVQVLAGGQWNDMDLVSFCNSPIRKSTIGSGKALQIGGARFSDFPYQRIGLRVVSSEGDTFELWSKPYPPIE